MIVRSIKLNYGKIHHVALRMLCAGKRNGIVYSQGQGVFGALGLNSELTDSNTFKPVREFVANDFHTSSFSIAAAGWGHSAVVSKSGCLHIFGRPFDFSNLLRIDKIYRFSKWVAKYIAASSNSLFFGRDSMGSFPLPTPVDSIDKIIDLTCSAGLTVFLTEPGDVYSFGLNTWNQCGIDSVKNGNQYQPIKVPGLPPCQRVEAGLQHCIALTKEGEVYTWGKATKGQIGVASSSDTKDLPLSCLATHVSLEGVLNKSAYARTTDTKGMKKTSTAAMFTKNRLKATHISAGFAHSAAISSDGAVYVWGRGMSEAQKDKKLVAGSMAVCEDQLIPRRVSLPGGRRAVNICSSNFVLVILAEDGSLWAMGTGEHDRNGNPTPLRVQTDFHFPAPVSQGTERIFPVAEVDSEDGKHYLLLPTIHDGGSVQLFKGHQRVALVMREDVLTSSEVQQNNAVETADSDGIIRGPTMVNRARFPEQGMYEVVLHLGEAYLIEMPLPLSEDDPSRRFRLVHYSSGWRHNLMIADNIE